MRQMCQLASLCTIILTLLTIDVDEWEYITIYFRRQQIILSHLMSSIIIGFQYLTCDAFSIIISASHKVVTIG
jgi:hypothetical protein